MNTTPPATIHTLPDSLTLEDLHLSSVKVGDEVTTIKRADNGGLSVGSTVFLVHAVEPDRVRVRRPDKAHSTGSWLVKNGGGCAWGMHALHVLRDYYSANPEHIARAKQQAARQKAENEAREKAAAEALAFAQPLGDELGDGWDSEEGYRRETAAQTLAEKLTPEQMRTLAGWLGVKVD